MDYLQPKELAVKMIDAGEEKINLSTRDTLIRAAGAGALLTIAAFMALNIIAYTGSLFAGSLIFPIGFIMLNMLKFDLVTGAFCLSPLPVLAGRAHCSWGKVARNWALVFIGNFIGALFVAFICAFSVRFAFTGEAAEFVKGPLNGLNLSKLLTAVGEARTNGFEAKGAAGWWTCFARGVLCNWMVSMGVIGGIYAQSTIGKFFCMWAPIFVFFFCIFEHAVVNMFLFPFAMLMGADITLSTYFLFNEIPTVLGNIVGGFCLVGLPIFLTYYKTGKSLKPEA
jgi:formate transporter